MIHSISAAGDLSAPPAQHTWQVGGETLVLHATKTVYLPHHHTLLVADVHLGKAASFRKLGVPVPSGTTADNLQRLTQAIEVFKPDQLVVLGDWVHARRSHSDEMLAHMLAWRRQHSQVHMALVEGNHDLQAGALDPALNIQPWAEPHRLGALALCHHPLPASNALVVCGHQHPVYTLQGKGRTRLRLPCFHLSQGQLTLPSFGAFTGGHAVKPQQGDQIVLVA